MKRTPEQSKAIHTLLSQKNLMEVKAELVLSFTDGRTESSRELEFDEAKALIRHLKGNEKTPWQRTKAKIINHLCRVCGFVTGANEPDYERIDQFIQNIGSRNPERKILRKLSYLEMCHVCTQVVAMGKHETERWIKQIPK